MSPEVVFNSPALSCPRCRALHAHAERPDRMPTADDHNSSKPFSGDRNGSDHPSRADECALPSPGLNSSDGAAADAEKPS